MTSRLLRPFGPPIGCFEIPESIILGLNALVDSGDEEHLSSHGDHLAGEVSDEVRLSSDICEKLGIGQFLASATMQYIKDATSHEIKKFVLLDACIVRQWAGDYNPIHFHSGHISGAGWLMVPEGMTSGSSKPGQKDGCICFSHGSQQFLSSSTYTVRPRVGLFTIFPHYLMHSVYPFRVQGERRSLAFNALIDDYIFDVYG